MKVSLTFLLTHLIFLIQILALDGDKFQTIEPIHLIYLILVTTITTTVILDTDTITAMVFTIVLIVGIIHIIIPITHIIGILSTTIGILTITHTGFTGIIGTINMVIMVQIFTIKQTLISLTV